MLLLLTAMSAHADTWSPWYGGIASVPRSDAPRDARILVHSNVPLAPVLLVEGEDPVPLATSTILDGYRSFEGRIAVLPPEGGWPVGVPLTVRADAAEDYTGTDTLTFTAAARLSPPATSPVLLSAPAVGPWVSGQVPGGCCGDAREVSVVVAVSSDPWSVVQLVASEGEIEVLEAETLGDGTVTMTWTEWRREGDPTPLDTCVGVFHLGAAGDVSEGISACSEERPHPDAVGCTSTGGAGSGFGWLAAAVLGILRSRRR